MAIIETDKIQLDKTFIADKSGILNALNYTCAQYIYEVIKKHKNAFVVEFDKRKIKELKSTIVHKNAHLDEYFAELFFRSILPTSLKAIKVSAHVMKPRDSDSDTEDVWQNAAIFGINDNEFGNTKALVLFDEHKKDGTREKLSCSQIVVDQFLIGDIPESIHKVLHEVNLSDSRNGAHEYNLKNIISVIHDVLFTFEKDGNFSHKNLTENWKRAIIDSCIVAVIYAYENKLLNTDLTENNKIYFEKITKRSLDYFIEQRVSKEDVDLFERVKKNILYKFKVGNHTLFDRAFWKDNEGNNKERQVLILPIICYSLHKCWGSQITQFIMLYIWQAIFQKDINFQELKSIINTILNESKINETKFGKYQKIIIENPNFNPIKRKQDNRKRVFKDNSPFWVYSVSLTNPIYFNLAAALKSSLNADYSSKGNNGFGILLLHDKTINSKVLSVGGTVPYDLWKSICDEIFKVEPNSWFFLKKEDGTYADFALNRTKAHQESLPSELVDLEFLLNIINEYSVKKSKNNL